MCRKHAHICACFLHMGLLNVDVHGYLDLKACICYVSNTEVACCMLVAYACVLWACIWYAQRLNGYRLQKVAKIYFEWKT